MLAALVKIRENLVGKTVARNLDWHGSVFLSNPARDPARPFGRLAGTPFSFVKHVLEFGIQKNMQKTYKKTAL